MEVTYIRPRPNSRLALISRRFVLAASRLKVFWRPAIWQTVVRRAISKRKTLSICETVALGDRRFISVIQFEQQRFLIGSSPSSVALLARLSKASANVAQPGDIRDTRAQGGEESEAAN